MAVSGGGGARKQEQRQESGRRVVGLLRGNRGKVQVRWVFPKAATLDVRLPDTLQDSQLKLNYQFSISMSQILHNTYLHEIIC